MKPLLHAALLALLLSANGCISYSRDQIGFWDQCVKADAWGISMISPYGPINLGRILWERNTACGKDIKQQELPLGQILK